MGCHGHIIREIKEGLAADPTRNKPRHRKTHSKPHSDPPPPAPNQILLPFAWVFPLRAAASPEIPHHPRERGTMAGGPTAVSFLTNIAKAAAGLGFGAPILSASLFTVDGSERTVIFDRFRGMLPQTVSEGTHFIVPWLQKPYIFDIRTRPHNFSSNSGTKDLQMVNLTLRLLSRPDVEHLPTIFTSLGLEYDDKVLPSIGNEVLKAVVAQFNADQLLTERPHVSALVRDALIRRAREFNIILDDVAITHLSYGIEFSQAQEAERSKFLVAKAEQEKRAAIVRAEGESESARLISEATAMAGNGLIELRRIEAAKEIAAELSRTPNVAYIPSGDNGKMLLGLDAAGFGR
ncbi:hypothetical protein HU200_043610 [Digitaria exilis]|uniref:Prohibitin n=1 Tax=Digitaria exilis TaxID=1010633 RepID=A0A835BB09_9POAL|nr:hypothetical protein HU200_043610 [Digitaria exilis]